LANVANYDIEKITTERDSLMAQIQEASITRFRKTGAGKTSQAIKDVITEKKEQAIMTSLPMIRKAYYS